MEKLYFIGDNHNAWEDFQTEILGKGIRNANIIQLGDGAFGCFATRKGMFEHWRKQNAFLQGRGIMLYNIRGNHDNPYWFMPKDEMIAFFRKQDKAVPVGLREDYHYLFNYMPPEEFAEAITTYTNIKMVPDYAVLELNGHRILCIGGAVTIDRMMRVEGRDYYKNEVLVHKPDVLAEIRDVDMVATHTIPDFIPPFKQDSKLIQNYRKHDTKLIGDLINERRVMTNIYNDIAANNNVNQWFYGHFHQWNNTHYKDTQFLCLPPNKTYEVKDV